jgi:serine/threonine protein kinase
MAANIILPENGPIWHRLREGEIDGIDMNSHSTMLRDFIKSMLNTCANSRPSSLDLLKHPMIREQLLDI